MTNLESLYTLGGISADGPRVLTNASFEGESFQRLLIGPGSLPGATVLVKDCTFRRCVVRGEFRVAHGARLVGVAFDEIRSPDMLTISTQSVLDQVIVRGSSGCPGLWVKPSEFGTSTERQEFEEWRAAQSVSIQLMLDFSELQSKEVEVLGLPLDKLRWDRTRHVALRLERFRIGAWKDLDFSPTSFWRLRLKRLELFDVTEGVFSLPQEGDKKFAQTMTEMALLVQAGILD